MKQLVFFVFVSLLLINCKSTNTPKYSSVPMEVETLIGEEGETVVLQTSPELEPEEKERLNKGERTMASSRS